MTKQVLDVNQMQHLQELGLELKDTMLYWIKPLDAVIGIVVGLENDWQLDFIDDKKKKYLEYIPAYTLQDVLDALPKNIYREYIGWTKLEIQAYSESKYVVGYRYIDTCDKYIVYRDGEELIDVAYTLLCWAIETGYVETNKNE